MQAAPCPCPAAFSKVWKRPRQREKKKLRGTDSITAGFCNMCETAAADPLAPADHNEAYDATWDFQIGEMLNAQVHTAAWSGLGMCASSNGRPQPRARLTPTVAASRPQLLRREHDDAIDLLADPRDGEQGQHLAVVELGAGRTVRQSHALLICPDVRLADPKGVAVAA